MKTTFYLLLFVVFLSGTLTGQDKDFSSYSQEIPGTDEAIEMVPISGGTFLMGSPENEAGRSADEGPQKEVEVESFWMGAYEITWDQYDLFLQDNAEEINQMVPEVLEGQGDVDAVTLPTPEYIDMSFGMGREGGYPAVNMTNYAAVMFTKWLYFKTGVFYRLPTEAEWEYAARAGSEDPYFFGKDASDLETYAWFEDNSSDGYSKIGEKKPNSFGLYDILGNVSEWTADQYKEDYYTELKGKTARNPHFAPTTLYPRSVRGGSWMDPKEDLRSAKRVGSEAAWKQLDPQIPKSIWWLTSAPFVGFRVIRPAKTPPVEEMEKYWIGIMKD